jgi:hypothetical protein
MPWLEYILRMCHRIGISPISIMGLGLRWDSSLMRVPSPPARMTAFMGRYSKGVYQLRNCGKPQM